VYDEVAYKHNSSWSNSRIAWTQVYKKCDLLYSLRANYSNLACNLRANKESLKLKDKRGTHSETV
jgi:hypothetical protein